MDKIKEVCQTIDGKISIKLKSGKWYNLIYCNTIPYIKNKIVSYFENNGFGVITTKNNFEEV